MSGKGEEGEVSEGQVVTSVGKQLRTEVRVDFPP